MISNNNREYITVIEIVNVIETVIKSILILLRKVHLERFYRDLKNEVLISLSDTEYVNDKLIFTYIQHFERQSRRIQKDVHRILLCNDYESHLTKEILEFCKFWSIHFFTFSLHSIYFL